MSDHFDSGKLPANSVAWIIACHGYADMSGLKNSVDNQTLIAQCHITQRDGPVTWSKTNMNMTYTIKGQDAIRLAERDNLTLRKYADPIDGARVVTVDEAIEIAREDSSLIYVTVTQPTDRVCPAQR